MTRWGKIWRLVMLALAFHSAISAAANERSAVISFRAPSTILIGKDRYRLENEQAVSELLNSVEKRLSIANTNAAIYTKKETRALGELAWLSRRFLTESSQENRDATIKGMIEIASAAANNSRSSVPEYVDLIEAPIRLADALSNPVAKGTRPASNLQIDPQNSDLSLANPKPSTYWSTPASIRDADLYFGFGRRALPNFDRQIWRYAGPKKTGWNAGCELVANDWKIKAKFGETRSEPFVSRIFHALGYNVDPVDFTPRLRIRYDRRFFTEFNSREHVRMKAGVFFVPLYRINFKEEHDPFRFVESAVFKNGERISGDELKQRLHTSGRNSKSPAFNVDAEEQIDFLVTKEANIQIESNENHSIGPWHFGELGRPHLRELRGAGLLAAWLGWWDSRLENTRLKIVEQNGVPALKHYFSDLGGGLGRSGGPFSRSNETPNDFPWTFTKWRDGRFQIINYEPIEDTPPFAEMTTDDARWMARLIGQLSKAQIVDALIVAGFESAEVRVYAEKLVARRDQLIRDLNLTDEIPLLGSDVTSARFFYDPLFDGPMTRPASGQQARAGNLVVRRGQVEPR